MNYTELQQRLAHGWNTWNTESVTSHVLLPEGFALDFGLREFQQSCCLKNPLVGKRHEDDATVRPGPHACDGSYTELSLEWRGIEITIQTAVADGDFVALVTTTANQWKPALLLVESGMLWNRPGGLARHGSTLTADLPNRSIQVFATTDHVDTPWALARTPYLALSTSDPIGISTGRERSLEAISQIVSQARESLASSFAAYGPQAEVYEAVQTCMAWDTIYEPHGRRVMSTVSRNWNCGNAGYIIFEWDNYFAGLLAGLENRDLAYANVVEMTRAITDDGMVPNFTSGTMTSYDRSEPPVGGLMVLELYQTYGDAWLLEEVFADLLRWNRWWAATRDHDGLLCWGSTPYEPRTGSNWEMTGVNERLGGSLESGLDNSPMYDDIPFNSERHQLELADVGLTSLYIADCDALAEMAAALGEATAEKELQDRAEHYRQALQQLWCEETGLFLNRRTDTGEFEHRLSPTHFYPLVAGAASREQAQRMIAEHFYNPAEFWGEWVLPSIARNDPAYPDNSYWRGRIWAPMNFLVYLGLRRYGFDEACRQLADKSAALLLKEWRDKRHVHENYNADNGDGCDVPSSDPFYFWGGLLGAIAILDRRQSSTDNQRDKTE